MIDLMINGGDLVVSEFGDLSLLQSDEDNIIQTANLAICTRKGSNIFHPEYGNDVWNRRVKMSESGFRIVEACSKDAILNSSNEILDVTSIRASRGNAARECNINYTLSTVNGRLVSGITSINIL